MKPVLAIVILIATVAVKPVGADPRFGADAHGGWNHYGMQAANDTLSSFNREYGTALQPIGDGGSWGMGLRLWPRSDVRMRLGFENLRARSKDSGVKFDFGVRAFTLGVTWFAPSTGWIRYGAGVELGPHYAQGGLDVPGASLRSSGSGFGGHLAGEVMVPLRNGWSLEGAIGYRVATIDGVKLDNSASGLRAQYDGVFLRIGMAVDAAP